MYSRLDIKEIYMSRTIAYDSKIPTGADIHTLLINNMADVMHTYTYKVTQSYYIKTKTSNQSNHIRQTNVIFILL